MRKIQHIARSGHIRDAKSEGKKVTALCGKRVYPMTMMRVEIPTCTKCSRVVLDNYADLLLGATNSHWSWSA